MTYTHYISLGIKRAAEKLNKIILSNFKDLETILIYNIRNNITFYRMTSNLIPLLTHKNVNIKVSTYKSQFKRIGNIIEKNNIRIDTHPDQFCVLNSDRSEVVDSSITILQNHFEMFKYMNYSGSMIIHIGSKVGGKKEGTKRFNNNFNRLDQDLQRMILLENDDKIYNISNTLKLCEDLKIKMVLDYHHHLCNNSGQKIEDYIERIFNTWGEYTPKIHFSSPKSKKDKRAHHDYINVEEFILFINKIKFINRDFDIMLEAKMKDEALFRLVRELKFKTNYEFINETTFLI
jgi:UV DNA damage endonuclease